jgi:hypothetical protein
MQGYPDRGANGATGIEHPEESNISHTPCTLHKKVCTMFMRNNLGEEIKEVVKSLNN